MPDIFFGVLDFDVEGPVVDGFSPASGATDVLVTSPISFNVTDAGFGVDVNSIDVTVSAVPAIVNGLFAPGFSGTITPIVNGYTVAITSGPSLPYSQLVSVDYYVQDLGAVFNVTTGSWSFTTEADLTGPVITNQTPADLAEDVSATTSISFEAVDPETNVKQNTLALSVNAVPAVVTGVIQPGFTGSITPITNGWHVSVTPASIFGSYELVSVEARATNDSVFPIETIQSWSFRTADVDAPVITAVSPVAGGVGVSVGTSIVFTVEDAVGADELTIDVDIAGVPAIVDGVFQAGFSGTIVTALPITTVTITPAAPFASYQTVNVSAYAEDTSGNPASLSWSFVCADITAPTIDNQIPAAGATSVPPNTAIFARALDGGSGVNPTSIYVAVNADAAVVGGVYQTGFFGSIDPIAGGYEIHVHRTALFNSFEVVQVSCDVTDNAGNTASSFWQFQILDDIAPSISNQAPAAGAIDIPISSSVSFHATDMQSGIDDESVQVTINSQPAIVDGVVQAGFTGSLAPILNGYHVTVTPTALFATLAPVSVSVDVADLAGNTTSESWSFTTSDAQGPETTNEGPPDNATDVNKNAAVTFEITDAHSGVNQTTLDVTINGVPAVVDGIFQPGFTGTIVPILNGFAVTVQPDTAFPFGTTQTVIVEASDLATVPNTLSHSWSFTVESDNIAPVVSGFTPANLATEVALNASVSFTVADVDSGIDPSGITVILGGTLAVFNGVAQPGFTVALTPIADGYSVQVGHSVDWDANDSILVQVSARDLAVPPNTANASWTFLTLTDTIGPAVSGLTPANGATNVPITTSVSFDVTDTITGVVLSSLDVTVLGQPAVTGGVVQSGFTGSVTAISNGYAVALTPVTVLTGLTPVDIDVEVDDVADNTTLFSWSFTTEATIVYLMRAYCPATSRYVFWTSTAPDPIGVFSPCVPVIDIVVFEELLSGNKAYVMRGWNIVTNENIYWVSFTNPDPFGLSAPVPPYELSDIVVTNVIFGVIPFEAILTDDFDILVDEENDQIGLE